MKMIEDIMKTILMINNIEGCKHGDLSWMMSTKIKKADREI
jgi:hypothetical protein